MTRKLTVLGLATLALGLMTGGTAEAHKISKHRVERVSHGIAKDLCQDDNTCDGVEVEPCHRKSKHVARCKVHYFGEDARGPYDCHWIFEWEIKEGSNALRLSRQVFENTLVCHGHSGGHFRRVRADVLKAR